MTPPYPPPPPPPPVPPARERLTEERIRQIRLTGACIVTLTILAAIFMVVIIGKVI